MASDCGGFASRSVWGREIDVGWWVVERGWGFVGNPVPGFRVVKISHCPCATATGDRGIPMRWQADLKLQDWTYLGFQPVLQALCSCCIHLGREWRGESRSCLCVSTCCSRAVPAKAGAALLVLLLGWRHWGADRSQKCSVQAGGASTPARATSLSCHYRLQAHKEFPHTEE